ncbi:MAG: thioredoxin domain-containing protein [Acidimicrobiales bacterium]
MNRDEGRENRLATSSSPYLLQHAHDPVDWYPFGPEALARAAELDRPLFLSIGYSACHWCHVMAHESFADTATAKHMNETVVAVKVDREERPDVDAIYMDAVQAQSGSGGWPMSVFCTPDGRPFFAGTYFPDIPRHGSPAFRQVLSAVADLWENRRPEVLARADRLREAVAGRQGAPPPLEGLTSAGTGRARTVALTPALLDDAVHDACERLVALDDAALGGFGSAPKFPQPLFIDLLLRAHVAGIGEDLSPRPIEVALRALEAMAAGGIYDHVGFGFARYSVDSQWLVPHFEKMLYDQALLARAYLHAFQVTGERRFCQTLSEILAYVLRDLRLESGGLASAEDADSEGEEGRFYLWESADMEAVLGPELWPAARDFWGVAAAGNFEGRSILRRPPFGDPTRSAEIEEARRLLFDARARRVRPGLDTKVLAEWNAMMVATLAEAALVTGEASWANAAAEIGELLHTQLRRAGDGRVLRSLPVSGQPELLGYSTDVAWMIEAFVRLAELTGSWRWLARAGELADQLLARFSDPLSGGLYTSGDDGDALVVRPRELADNVTPSAASVAAGALARLGGLSGGGAFAGGAERLVASGASLLLRAPTAVPELLGAADLVVRGTVDVAVTGGRADLVAVAARSFEPRVVVAWAGDAEMAAVPLLSGREAPGGAAFVCRFGECRLPASSAETLEVELRAALAR